MMNNQSMIKDEVYKQDMPNDMIKACQSAARRALQESSYGSSSNKEQAMASSVRKAMESQYPGTWSCVCGQRFGSEVAYIKDHFVFFSVDGMSFMVFKSAEHR